MSKTGKNQAVSLTSDLTQLTGIGDKTAALFEKIGITTVSDLLQHFPRSYDRYDDPIPVADLSIGETATIAGTIKGPISSGRSRKLSVTTTTLVDLTGAVKVTWFRLPYIKKTIHSGQAVILRGRCVQNRWGIQLTQPEVFTSRERFDEKRHAMQPVYARPQGLSNQTVIKAVRQVLPLLEYMEDPLPEAIRKKYRLITLGKALEISHFPENEATFRKAHERLCFDEFLNFILRLRLIKSEGKTARPAPMIMPGAFYQALSASLPYQLTQGQQQTMQEILGDMERSEAMSRLVQGDVGCGKTILAVLAMLAAADSGYQAAIMAPTQVLAVQHYETIRRLLAEADIDCSIYLLTGDTQAAKRRDIQAHMESGKPGIFVGTQALIQRSVSFGRLGLVVTDEQHRFGVRQRATLTEQGESGFSPHVLVMSATPIPRTLGIILYGDLSISQIHELPAGRLPVKNAVMHSEERDKVFRFIKGQISEGRQAYIICPLVDASDNLEAEAVTTYTEELAHAMGDGVKIEALHGRMKATDKDRILSEYTRGETDILVSTSVVEVGINIPNATVMLIENADRFGLAQLHQLRGRIGRGEHQAYCVFMTSRHDEKVEERLSVISHSNDGFEIATEDLKARGPGDLFGLKQSGFLSFERGDIFQDSDILTKAASAADDILAKSPDLKAGEYRLLSMKVHERDGSFFEDAGRTL